MSSKVVNKERITQLEKEINARNAQVMLSLCRMRPYDPSAHMFMAYGNNTWMTRQEALDLMGNALKAEGYTIMPPPCVN